MDNEAMKHELASRLEQVLFEAGFVASLLGADAKLVGSDEFGALVIRDYVVRALEAALVCKQDARKELALATKHQLAGRLHRHLAEAGRIASSLVDSGENEAAVAARDLLREACAIAAKTH